jgi:hypothetical protein
MIGQRLDHSRISIAEERHGGLAWKRPRT